MSILRRLINEVYIEKGPEQTNAVYGKALREKFRAELTEAEFDVIDLQCWADFTRPALHRYVKAWSIGRARYKQLGAFSVDEYRSLIVMHVRQAGASSARAYEVAKKCEAKYSVWIDPSTVLNPPTEVTADEATNP